MPCNYSIVLKRVQIHVYVYIRNGTNRTWYNILPNILNDMCGSNSVLHLNMRAELPGMVTSEFATYNFIVADVFSGVKCWNTCIDMLGARDITAASAEEIKPS
jgi:hypothetical protein